MLVDGVNLLTGTYPDQVVANEVDVRTFGNGPDISAPGAVISLVTKSGSNEFHGRYEEQYQSDALQANNLDAVLKGQGLTTLDSTRYYNDLNGDLGGRARSVAKATYSRYNSEMSDSFAAPYNKNGVVTYTYRWTHPTRCDCYVPGTVNLNTNGPDFITLSGSINNIQNPPLKSPREHEITGSFQRELMPGTAMRVVYVHKRMADDLTTVNVLRPYSAYTTALTVSTPGPDGSVGPSSPPMTIYDYDPAYSGSAFVGNEIVNRPDSGDDRYQTIEVTLNRRPAGKWGVITSFSATKNHRWLTSRGVRGSPAAVPTRRRDR